VPAGTGVEPLGRRPSWAACSPDPIERIVEAEGLNDAALLMRASGIYPRPVMPVGEAAGRAPQGFHVIAGEPSKAPHAAQDVMVD